MTVTGDEPISMRLVLAEKPVRAGHGPAYAIGAYSLLIIVIGTTR